MESMDAAPHASAPRTGESSGFYIDRRATVALLFLDFRLGHSYGDQSLHTRKEILEVATSLPRFAEIRIFWHC